MDVRRAVVADFDFDLDAPGEVSDRGIEALLAHLGVSASPPDRGSWAARVDAAASAGTARLVDALGDTDVRRMAAFVLRYCDTPPPPVEVDDPPTALALHIARGVHHGWSDGDELTSFGTAFGAALGARGEPAMIDALLLCGGEPGEVLRALSWAEEGWNTPVHAVDDALHHDPAPHVAWLRAMAPEPLLANSAARTGDPSLVEPYGTALVRHDDVAVRRSAIHRLTEGWHSDAYQDAVADLLDDPELGEVAADRLAALRDDRCLPRLVARIPVAHGLAAAQPFGAELLPHVRRALSEPLPPGRIAALLTQPWGTPPLLTRPEAAAAVDRLAALGTDDAQWALAEVCQEISMTRRASPEMLTRLRVLAVEHPVRVRQYAQFALLELGDTDWLVPVLVRELTEHPVRTGVEGPHNGNFGWRADATACAWLGRIGPSAAAAVPVLRTLMAETGEPGDARPEAAEAYWRITGDATTALSVVDSLTTGDLGTRARAVAARVRT